MTRGDIALVFAIARRELRGGLRGFVLFLLCLAVGVAAIAAVGIVNRAVIDAVARDARALLGGDIEIENPMQPIDPATLDRLVPKQARLSRQVDLNSTVAAGKRRSPVRLKAVDDAYPLFGDLQIEPAMPLATAIADGGAIAEPALAARLGLEVGDRFQLGDATLVLNAILKREPDRIGGFVSIGPRVILSLGTLAASHVLQPGAIVDYDYYLALPPGDRSTVVVADIRQRFPDASWRLRTSNDVQPQLARTTDRLATYLTLAGVTSLLIGGLGVGLAVQSYLAGKVSTISTLKCLGASSRQIVAAYLLQILALAGLGVLAGVMLGQALALLLGLVPEALLPVTIDYGVHAVPLLVAGSAGLLTAVAFALWPLGMAREVSPAGLFRSLVAPARVRPRAGFLVAIAAAIVALAVIAVLAVPRPGIAAIFVGIALVSAAALLLVTRGLFALLRRWGELGPFDLRLAVRNLQRPGSGAVSVTIALGAGLAVLTTVTLLQVSLEDEIAKGVPERAPSTVFIDIQPDQVDRFKALVAAQAGVRLREIAPHLRARIVRLGGVPVDAAKIADDVRWTLNRDRGLTYRVDKPPYAELSAGSWWPRDYDGPPLLSVDEGIATGYGLGVGDTISLNILGRVIEAKIANLRHDVDFTSGRLEFFFIMNPGPLQHAPHTVVATVESAPDDEAQLIASVADALPNVTAISVGAIVEELRRVLSKIGVAVRVVAGVTILTGLLVLAGAAGAARRRQRYQTVLLKVLGARRIDLLRTLSAEYLVLGLSAAVVGIVLGTIGAWATVHFVFHLPWRFAPLRVAALAGGGVALIMALGALSTWRLLAASAAQVLRTP